ncbi:hypothetical protein [Deinococcus phoenicis]|uniref:hypothetical protein n=1 Tax=Deinococcus phoenicis TaxID=1476583 RepID=UPI0013771D3E|nr:hypothetical protein [Deinococcus phoenicis]
MRIPKQIKPENTESVKQMLSVFALSMKLLDGGMSWADRFPRGLITEKFLIENILCRTYAPEQIEWNSESLYRQLYGKPDGTPDVGYDVIADGMKIDSKYDSGLANKQIHLGLFTNSGTPLLLTKNKANVSAHVYIHSRVLCAVEKLLNKKAIAAGRNPISEHTLRILWIDLDKLRADLVETNGKYSIGKYSEWTVYRKGEPCDRIITLPMSFLLTKYGRLDTIEC